MRLRFVSKKYELGDVWSYFFEPAEPIEWIAGQSIRLELPRTTWGIDERRFTIASSPLEKQIRITTRLSNSDFKQNLHKLVKGSEVNAYNIEGDFIWLDSGLPLIFAAGGIGITPFRSILADRQLKNLDSPVQMFYSSKDNPAVFQSEFDQWQSKDPAVNFTYLFEQRLSAEILLGLENLKERIFYLSGPEQMVADLRKQLLESGINEKQIKTDEFTGYGY